MDIDRFTKIDTFFRHVSQVIDQLPINPKNVDEVKKEFFKEKYNPVFVYYKYPKELDSLRAILEVMQFGKSTMEQIYAAKRDNLVLEIRLKKAIGTDRLTKKSMKLYPKPGKKLIRIALQILTLPISPKDERIFRKDALAILKKAVKELDISWKVTSKKLVTSANVNTDENKIELNKGERFGLNYIQRLAVHEIGTHVLRAENGAKQQFDLFRSGLAGYLETEEGLAAYNEFTQGFMTNTSLRNYAGRVLAINYALEHDFQTTFKLLRKFFDRNIAFKLTVRAKRGLSDTSKPGAYTKDVVYLRGFLAVLTFAKNNPIEKLYVGKIGLHHVPLLSKIRGIQKPLYLPGSIVEKDIVSPGALQVDKNHVLTLLK